MTSSRPSPPSPQSRLAGFAPKVLAQAGLIAWAAALLVAFVLGVASGSYLLGRPSGTEASPSPETVTVRAGTLGRSVRMRATAEWSVVSRLYAPTSGIVTEAVATPGILRPGDIPMRIDERPLVVVPGEVPAYRRLEEGARGRDVASLQRYLQEAGFSVDDDLERFTSVTAAGVRAWQRSLGLPPTGVVLLGDVLLVPPKALGVPTRWTSDIAPGAPLAAGSPIIEVLSEEPALSIELGQAPSSEIIPGLRGEATFANGVRRAVRLVSIEATPGRVVARLGPESAPLCRATECLELVPVGARTDVTVDWIIVPETSGAMVPVAALQSDAAGGAFVELADGSRRPVDVEVVSGGMAIVSGLEVGEIVVVP